MVGARCKILREVTVRGREGSAMAAVYIRDRRGNARQCHKRSGASAENFFDSRDIADPIGQRWGPTGEIASAKADSAPISSQQLRIPLTLPYFCAFAVDRKECHGRKILLVVCCFVT